MRFFSYLCNRKPQLGCADIVKKRLLALVLAVRKLETFTQPKARGSKRPLGYVYPARRASIRGLLCLVAFHIRRGRYLLILVARFFQYL